jgi:UDP-N-acetylmuramoyl-tripeptide--D-alanyl-D-alanine ligase
MPGTVAPPPHPGDATGESRATRARFGRAPAIVGALALTAGAAMTLSRWLDAPSGGRRPSAPGAPAAAPAATADAAACRDRVTRAELERSLSLGLHYLLAHQRADGTFVYEYDWRARTYAQEDNAVRQAGALWGLAVLRLEAERARFDPPPGLRGALLKGLSFHTANAGLTDSGAPRLRFPTYAAGDTFGSMGTAALLALALIDFLRAEPPSSPDAPPSTEALAGVIAFLVAGRDPAGLWYGRYDLATGRPYGDHSPYADGEALLALVKARKYLGRQDLAASVLTAAQAGHDANVVAARAAEADSPTTKGYYQWASMAYFELATSDDPKAARYGEWLLDLADWMIDVHRTLERRANTGYAYEGLVPAYAYALERGDAARAARYACVIHEGLGKLMGLQVGHPRATALGGGGDDPAALGGVQNEAAQPTLRIDVTQHQMHATSLALRHLF